MVFAAIRQERIGANCAGGIYSVSKYFMIFAVQKLLGHGKLKPVVSLILRNIGDVRAGHVGFNISHKCSARAGWVIEVEIDSNRRTWSIGIKRPTKNFFSISKIEIANR